jgi:cell division protein FtsN
LVLACLLFICIIIFATFALLKKKDISLFRNDETTTVEMSETTTLEAINDTDENADEPTTEENSEPVSDSTEYEYSIGETTVYQNPPPPPVQVPTSQPSGNSPFYGVWVGASKNQTEAQNIANEVSQYGFSGQVFITTDWSNLNNEAWYVVTAGTYSSKSSADAALSSVKKYYADAYVKYSGDWKGGAISHNITESHTEKHSENHTETYSKNHSESHPAFYGIWVGASKNQTDAQNIANKVSQCGFSGQVFITTDWSNLNNEAWYVVTAGTYSSKSSADAALSSVKKYYADAYVKYSGDWKG